MIVSENLEVYEVFNTRTIFQFKKVMERDGKHLNLLSRSADVV